MINLLLLTNLFDPTEVIVRISEDLQVEKRRKKRPLQMSSILSYCIWGDAPDPGFFRFGFPGAIAAATESIPHFLL